MSDRDLRREAKRIVNDLTDKVYCGDNDHKRLDIQFARNPWFSVGIHFDHSDPSITLHLPGVLVYLGNCKQPGFRFWNKIIPGAIVKFLRERKA